MSRYGFSAPVGLVLGLFLMLAACAPQHDTAALAAVPALQPNMARVWVLRQVNVEFGNAAAADPIVYVDNASLGQVAQGTVFYHDLPPGTYRFRAQAYGTPAHLGDTVTLGPETTAYLLVQWVPNWEMRSRVGGDSFDVMTMVPYDARVAVPTLTFLGAR